MPNRGELLLVKDFDQSGIFYYWLSAAKEKLSPDVATLEEAKEWFTEHIWSFYDGRERRQRVCDRRTGVERRNNSDRTVFGQRRRGHGRRSTDFLLKVDIDLFAEKVAQFRSG